MTPTTIPGLDVTALRARRARNAPTATEDTATLLQRVEAHLEAHDGYVAFSGGKDSTVVLDLARRVDSNVPVVFFDSGLEYPETLTYIDQIANDWDLNLNVIAAQPSLLEILTHSGHWDHHAPRLRTPNLHATLITAPAAAAHDRFGPGELWGIRSAEARGRRILHAAALATHRNCECCTSQQQRRQQHGGIVTRVDNTTAYSPIWDWSTARVWEHLNRYGIPINPVYDKLALLGAPEHATRVANLVDANQLNAGRITWLRRGWPTQYAELLATLPRLADFT